MKTWKVILLVFIAFIIGVGVGSSGNSKKEENIDQINEKNIENKKEIKKQTLKEKCDQISNGDNIEKVKVILGKPSSTSETDMAGLGKMKYWIYSEDFKSCQIHFNSVDDVSTKSFVDL